MKILCLVILLNLPLCFAQAVENNECLHDKNTFKCVEYIKPVDGDTFYVSIKNTHPLFGQKIKVRVAGIDSPEVRTRKICEKKIGRIAKNLVDNLLKNSIRIDLENVKRDKYFRILADVKVDGVNLSSYLIKNKLAVTYSGGRKKKVDWCKPIHN